MKTEFHQPLFRTWLKFLLVVLPLPLIWSLANPMFASPDEPAHLIRAQGMIRGETVGPYVTDGLPANQIDCMKFQWDVTANCMNLNWGPKGQIQASTTDDYPPLFHVIAGVPSVVFKGLFGAFVTRIWLVLICSSLFAWSGTLLWTRHRHYWTLGGLVTALTPLVVFVSSTVNPSGLSTALASSIWASGINVSRPTIGTLNMVNRATFAVSLTLFPFVRRDSVWWELLILLLIATTLSRSKFSELKKDRVILGILLLAGASMALVWFRWSGDAMGSFAANGAEQNGGSIAAGFGSLTEKISEMIGWFGWLDSPMTGASFVILMCLLSLVLLVGALGGQKVYARAAAITFVVLLLTPVLIGAIRYPYVQGRYLLPLWVGCMLIVGVALAESDFSEVFLKRLFKLSIGVMALIQFFAFAQNLRRYAVGRTGTWKFFVHSNWNPPMMSNLVALEFALVAIVVSLVGVRILVGTEASLN
jgi:hypothetical protein